MKSITFLLLMMMSLNSFAQLFEVSKDSENGSIVLKGKITMGDLKNEPSFSWLKDNGVYTPDPVATQYLKENLEEYSLVVVMGTWCEDSQILVPKLYATLTQALFPIDQLTIYGVDRTKDALNGEKAQFNIERVPTIIVFKDANEVGRIVESVSKSIEQDLVDIISK